MGDKPFTKQEEEVFVMICETNEKFLKLDNLANTKEWNEAIHKLQDLMILRVARKDYPQYFR